MCDAAGTIEGDVRVSGHPKVQKTFARVMGYVEQTDIHSPNVSTLSHILDTLRSLCLATATVLHILCLHDKLGLLCTQSGCNCVYDALFLFT